MDTVLRALKIAFLLVLIPGHSWAQVSSYGRLPGVIASLLDIALRNERSRDRLYAPRSVATDLSFSDGYVDIVLHGLSAGSNTDSHVRVSVPTELGDQGFSNPDKMQLDHDTLLALDAAYGLFNTDQALSREEVEDRDTGHYAASFAERPLSITVHFDFVFVAKRFDGKSLDGCPPGRSYLVNRATLKATLVHYVVCP